jgi:RNA polymerase sigma-70 factor (ECF subfamily)
MTEEDPRTELGFAALYRRHAGPLTAFFMRRTGGDAELTADLVAETFAAALAGARRFDPARGAAVAWLYGIARNQLLHAQRRGRVDDRMRRRLGMERLQLTDAAIERVEALAAAEGTALALGALMDQLPPEQRAAVEARVLDERDYADIATSADTTEPVIRQRVSRGLARLRNGLKGGAL